MIVLFLSIYDLKIDIWYFIYKYQLSRIFSFKILVAAFCISASIDDVVEPSWVTVIGGSPGNAWVCVIRNLTIKFTNSNNSSPRTKLDVLGIISSTNFSSDIPYNVSAKLIFCLPGMALDYDNKNNLSPPKAP